MTATPVSELDSVRSGGVEHVAVEGVRLAVHRSGPRGSAQAGNAATSAAPAEASASAARPVLLLHGAGRTSAIWAPVSAQLATDRTVLALDRRGHGASERRPASPAQEASDYAALLVREPDDASNGGRGAPADPEAEADGSAGRTDVVAEGDAVEIALALAALRPDLVGRLVLVGGPAGSMTSGDRRGPARALARGLARGPAPAVTIPAPFPEQVLLVCGAPGGLDAGRRLMRDLVAAADDQGVVRMTTIPGCDGAPLDAAPATVTAAVVRFLRG